MKVGKTIKPFRYDLNQIPYDHTVEIRNRFKGLDLIDRVPDDAWWIMERSSRHCTGDRNQDHPQDKEMQKSKMAVWGGLTNSCEKKRSEKQRSKGKIYPFEQCCYSKDEIKMAYLSINLSISQLHSICYTRLPKFNTPTPKINLHLINKVFFISIYYYILYELP